MSKKEEVRTMIENLRDSVKHRWVDWDEWERDFIKDLTSKLSQEPIRLTGKQITKLFELWEKL